jgi:hypothetical protein
MIHFPPLNAKGAKSAKDGKSKEREKAEERRPKSEVGERKHRQESEGSNSLLNP